MSEPRRREQRPISVDGALFALVERQWVHVPRSRSTTTSPSPAIPEGYVSIDGAWFQSVDGELRPTGSPIPAPAAPVRAIPDGYVSVDGALLPIEPRPTG